MVFFSLLHDHLSPVNNSIQYVFTKRKMYSLFSPTACVNKAVCLYVYHAVYSSHMAESEHPVLKNGLRVKKRDILHVRLYMRHFLSGPQFYGNILILFEIDKCLTNAIFMYIFRNCLDFDVCSVILCLEKCCGL
jgi:hypothetical protein